MLHFSRTKIIAIAMVCLFGVVGLIPNFVAKSTLEGPYWPGFLPNKQLSLGLDLKGGAHLLLRIEEQALMTDTLKTLRGDVRKQLRDAKIGYVGGVGITNDRVVLRLRTPDDMETALTQLRLIAQQVGNPLIGSTSTDLQVSQIDTTTINVVPTAAGQTQRVNSAIAAAIEIIRKRIDSVGTTEPTIVRQGRDRILVQVPGFDDTARLKALIGKTARLSFHDVHPSISASEAEQSRVPIGYVLHPSADPDEPGVSYLLKERPVVRGDDLVDAQPSFSQETNEPIITFRFNQKGARAFGQYTSENVGRPFAIVLDNGKDETGKEDITVITAPVIQSPILGGSGQITGNFSVKTANDLAVQIRSGALPTPLDIIEERTVGPSLGEDSIISGEIAASVAAVLVAGFMFFAYGLFGLYALAAVLVNLILIVGVMSMIGSTLTLPGIAGLILTVGMAVDANVLIYERIREEMRNNKSPISAIESGFQRAFATIIDSNLTTLIAGIVMFWLGSGPVRGFAVTLSLGIFATMFTAFTVTRLLVALWVARQKTRKIPSPL
ncbi:MAG: protein translocase subunit SecD [Pseudomonadota bacterium]